MNTCKICSSSFQTNYPWQLHCSKKCSNKSKLIKASEKAKRRVRECNTCGIKYKKIDGGRNKYCSDRCGKSGRNMERKARVYGSPVVEKIDFHKVYERDGGKCSHCDKDLKIEDKGMSRKLSPEMDHIIPLALGGHHAMYNMQLLCKSCNSSKAAKIVDRDVSKARELFPDDLSKYILDYKKQSKKIRARKYKTASGYRGVIKDGEVYIARIWVNGRYLYIGKYRDKTIAAVEYNKKAVEIFGDDAILNEVDYG